MILMLVYLAVSLGLLIGNVRCNYKRISRIKEGYETDRWGGKDYSRPIYRFRPRGVLLSCALAPVAPISAVYMIGQSIDYNMHAESYDLTRELWVETRRVEAEEAHAKKMKELASRRDELERIRAERTRRMEASVGIGIQASPGDINTQTLEVKKEYESLLKQAKMNKMLSASKYGGKI